MIFGFTGSIIAQEAADKKVQAGLTLGYGLNFQNMRTKLLESGGVGGDFTIGANLNFSFNKTIGFNTGVEFDFESLKYNSPAGDSVYYYYNTDDNSLVQYDQISATNKLYKLESRKQKPMYISIPTMLIFRTNYIGYFRYFGKFGLRTSVLLSNKFNDTGANVDPADVSVVLNSDANNEMVAKGEMFPIKSAVGLGGGVEWNFTGGTVLVGELGYFYGFTPLYNDRKTEKAYLSSTGSSQVPPVFSNAAVQSQLMFKVSVLF